MCFGTLAFLGCDCNFCGVGLWLGTLRGLRARRLHWNLVTAYGATKLNAELSFVAVCGISPVFVGAPEKSCHHSARNMSLLYQAFDWKLQMIWLSAWWILQRHHPIQASGIGIDWSAFHLGQLKMFWGDADKLVPFQKREAPDPNMKCLMIGDPEFGGSDIR